MFASTPIWVPAHSTDLANAFENHLKNFRGQQEYALGTVESGWLNALRDRALKTREKSLLEATEKLLALLGNPGHYDDFKEQFNDSYEAARKSAYPVSNKIIEELHFHLDTTQDYTLKCIDLGQVRAIEDDALTDRSMKVFTEEMLDKLLAKTASPKHEVYRSVFDIYSEALVCRLLRERTSGRLKIEKIPESSEPGPDFECELVIELNGQAQKLSFYIEVKSLDIVHAPQRIPEMHDDGMKVQIELDRQVAGGNQIAIAEGVVAPYRGYGDDADYDPMSIRAVIEKLIQKAAGNFKNTQFGRGPTFALVNSLRLPLPGQGAGTLAPHYYDPDNSGSCVSGALWHLAFGKFGAPIHRAPNFEGEGTADGTLGCNGILVDPGLGLDSPGLIALHFDEGAYRFDGFFDPHWKLENEDWSDVQTGHVIHELCGDYNDLINSRAHEYAHFRKRRE